MAGFVPEGYHTVTPYLTCRDAGRALDFYREALGAVELTRWAEADGKIGFAEIQIGDSRLFISDEFPDIGVLSPQSLGGTPVGLNLYVEDVDASAARMLAAGATVLRPVADQGDGIRNGIFACPFGHRWFLTRRQS
jgi:PhnB protein